MLPEDPPEGCFWITMGRPIDPALLERIRSQDRESLCELFLSRNLKEQSRYQFLRAFFSTSFREFRALERRVMKSVGEICTVYVRLLGEGALVWRPVSARRVGPGLFHLFGAIPEGERWEFEPDQVVRCAVRVFSGGDQGLAAFERAGEPGEAST
jgi:hypothetical protein